MNKLIYIIILFLISSCSGNGMKEKMGLVKYQPDEYQVETNTSLSIPPDFNIHSPEELMANKSKTDQASDPSLSKGENLILQHINQQ